MLQPQEKMVHMTVEEMVEVMVAVMVVEEKAAEKVEVVMEGVTVAEAKVVVRAAAVMVVD